MAEISGKFYSPKQVRVLTGLSECTIWRLRKNGDFPEPVKLSPRRVGYPVERVDSWVAEKEAQ